MLLDLIIETARSWVKLNGVFSTRYLAQFEMLLGEFEDYRQEVNATPYSRELTQHSKLIDLFMGILINHTKLDAETATIDQYFVSKAKEILKDAR